MQLKYANLYCTDNPPNDEWSSVASYYGKTDSLYLKSDYS